MPRKLEKNRSAHLVNYYYFYNQLSKNDSKFVCSCKFYISFMNLSNEGRYVKLRSLTFIDFTSSGKESKYVSILNVIFVYLICPVNKNGNS